MGEDKDDLLKATPPPKFPKLGVGDDRRSIPIVKPMSRPHTNKIFQAFDANPLVPARPSPTEIAHISQHNYGMQVSTNAGKSFSFATADDARHDALATQQHEAFHEIMSRVARKHPGRREQIAQYLLRQVPPLALGCVQNYLGTKVHPDNPWFFEEAIAHLITYLNDPVRRKQFHFNAGFNDERKKSFNRQMKRAYRAIVTHARMLAPEDLEDFGEPISIPKLKGVPHDTSDVQKTEWNPGMSWDFSKGVGGVNNAQQEKFLHRNEAVIHGPESKYEGIVKVKDNESNQAENEVFFHNAAHHVFGLGHHVPLTAMHVDCDHPDYPCPDEKMSVQKWVPNVIWPADEIPKTLKNVLGVYRQDGTLHKLGMMDWVLGGNADRHSDNFAVSKRSVGGTKLHLIDNGVLGVSPGMREDFAGYIKEIQNYIPKYLYLDYVLDTQPFIADAAKIALSQPVHPEALRWIRAIDPRKLHQIYKAQGQHLGMDWLNTADDRLRKMQEIAKLVPNPKLQDVFFPDEVLHAAHLEKRELLEDYPTAIQMLGGKTDYDLAFEAASFLAGHDATDLDRHQSLKEYDGDPIGAALWAYQLPVTEENRQALQAIMHVRDFGKSEPIVWEESLAKSVDKAIDQEAQEAISRALDGGLAQQVHLPTKYAVGAAVLSDPKTGRTYLLKPANQKISPALGLGQETVSQARRDAAFTAIAELCGLGGVIPRSYLVQWKDGEAIAIRMLPPSFKNLEEIRKTDGINKILAILEPYRETGQLHRWAILDYLLGNTDRHAGNMMVGDADSLALIDHGSTMAGDQFDPTDTNTFVPFYLRAWGGVDFYKLSAEEKLKKLPQSDARTEEVVAAWVGRFPVQRSAEIMGEFGIDSKAFRDRFDKINASLKKIDFINRFWAGMTHVPAIVSRG